MKAAPTALRAPWVTFPHGSQRQYVHGSNAALIGVIDELGNQCSTIAYNSNDLAISTQLAGGADLTTIDYS